MKDTVTRTQSDLHWPERGGGGAIPIIIKPIESHYSLKAEVNLLFYISLIGRASEGVSASSHSSLLATSTPVHTWFSVSPPVS